jgi:hypothetical protein
MKKLLLSILFFSFFSSVFATDIPEEIAAAIRTGNSKNVSKYFIENIDLKVIEQEDVYSKQQAEMILKDFFLKHPVKSFAIIHKSAPKNGSQYIIGTLETTTSKFRIYFLIKSSGNETLIQQFRIESENE